MSEAGRDGSGRAPCPKCGGTGRHYYPACNFFVGCPACGCLGFIDRPKVDPESARAGGAG